jgi:outer membrane protein assembly factor BamB
VKRLFLACVLVLLLATLTACTAPLPPSWASVTLVGDEQTILLANNQHVTAVNPRTGQRLELRNREGQVLFDNNGRALVVDSTAPDNSATSFYAAPVLLDNGNYLVASYNRKLYTFDLQSNCFMNNGVCAGNGAPATEILVPGHIVTAPVLGPNNRLYVAYGDNQNGVTAFDISIEGRRQTLQQVWNVPIKHGVWGRPLLVDDVLYVAALNHYVYALNPDDGSVLWRTSLGGAVTSTPVYHDGRLYVGSFARKVVQLDASNGAVLAEFATQDWVWGAPTLHDGVLYVADMQGFVYALEVNQEGGLTQRWQRKVANGSIRATPIYHDDMLIVASRDYRVYWLNAADGTDKIGNDGQALVRNTDGEILADMVLIMPNDTLNIAEPLLLVSTMLPNKQLIAFTISNGAQQWVYPQ